MPYTVVKDGPEDKPFCVYKMGADDKPVGDALGCHPDADKAGAQIGAIEKEEGAKHLAIREGRVLSSHDHEMFSGIVKDLKQAAHALQEYVDTNAPKAREAVAALTAVRMIKATPDTMRVGGYGIVWGGKDLYKTYFTRKTNFWDGKFGDRPVALYDHGLNPQSQKTVLGHVDVQRDDDIGRWIEMELDAHNQYVAAVGELVKQGALGLSSGSIAHLVEIEQDGEIRSWPIVEFSMTATPAEPRTLGVQELRSLAEVEPTVQAFIPQTETQTAQPAGVQAGGVTASTIEAVSETKSTEVDKMGEMDVSALVADAANKAADAALKAYLEKMAAATPPEKVGAAMTLENAPKDGSGTKSLGNFLLCVATRNEKRLREVYGAARTAMAEDAGATGGYLVPAQFLPKLMQVVAEKGVVRSHGAFVQPMAGRDLDIPYLKQSTANSAGNTNFFGGVVASWTEEAGDKTEKEPTIGQMKLVAHELSGYTLASNMLMADNAVGLEALLVQLFGGAIGWYEDYAFLQGNGVGKPLGIYNSPAAIEQTRSSDGHFVAADVGAMMAQFLPSSWGKGVWFMNPTVIPDLIDLRNTGNYPLVTMGIGGPLNQTLMGMPIVFTEKLGVLGADFSVLLADLSYYVIGDKGQISIDSSADYKFINNQTTWRFVQHVDGQPWIDGPIYLSDGSKKVSPFVYLGGE